MVASSSSFSSGDIAIIGAGPVGLFSVFACGQLGMACHLFDSLQEAGGQCAALYPEKPIYDIPAYPSIEASVLIAQLKEQASPYAPHYHLGCQIAGLEVGSDVVTLRDHTGETFTFKAVVIAAGGGAFVPNKPPIEHIEAYEGKSVFYSVQDVRRFQGRRVVIIGGGDSALDWACALAETARHVTLVHRRDKFRAVPETVRMVHEKAQQGQIDVVTPYVLESVDGDVAQGTLRAVGLKTLKGEKKRVDADDMLAFFGLASQLGPISGWRLQFDNHRLCVNATTLETSLSRVFAVGDIVTYPHKLKLILCGFSEAAMAAQSIYALLHDGKKPRFQYSTAKGDPAQTPR
ncbi:MAG: NAD(P)/FAD-dependent oxidoreductase [Alphaproteobacteria bacterium GM7ARS4]|nr:NAD(P)/FAD-dependent oxidoreductase [Alphaproteobacteria bacterium GM7ARS4]